MEVCGVKSCQQGQQDVLAALQDYDAAAQASDIDAMLAFFSNHWQSGSGTTKAAMREHLQSQIDNGSYETQAPRSRQRRSGS